MTSLCRHLSPISVEIVNWVMTADGCVQSFTAPTRRNSTSLLANLFRVQTRRYCRQLVANCVGQHTADATRQLSRVGGVYWTLVRCGSGDISRLHCKKGRLQQRLHCHFRGLSLSQSPENSLQICCRNCHLSDTVQEI